MGTPAESVCLLSAYSSALFSIADTDSHSQMPSTLGAKLRYQNLPGSLQSASLQFDGFMVIVDATSLDAKITEPLMMSLILWGDL